MTWADPSGELRTFLSDTTNDNFVKEKRLIGTTDGVNRIFYTFEDRILASGNQSVMDPTLALRVFWQGSEVAASGILVTDQIRGEFQLTFSPSGLGEFERLTGSYFFRQHLAAELTTFLTRSASQVGVATVADVALELQTPVTCFAASFAHTKLAQRWQQRKSEQFMLDDEPARQEAEARISFHQQEAERLYRMAREMRRDFYETSNDRNFKPAYGLLKRTPQPYTPRR